VFIALIIAILGGFAKIFGFIGQPWNQNLQSMRSRRSSNCCIVG
jgi:hypothetical protein